MTFEQTPHTYGRSLLSYLLRDTNPTHDPNKHSLNKHSPITHVRDLPGRDPHYAPWPTWILPAAKDWLNEQGIAELYTHQVATANLAWEGNHVVVATGTASGKTLGYHLPIITQLAADPNATALYLSILGKHKSWLRLLRNLTLSLIHI